MKKEMDSRLVIGIIAALVLVLGFFGWRMFAGSGSSNNKLSPQEAGLGKPVYPAGGATPGQPSPGGTPTTQ